ncbi:autophagy-related protein 20 [Monosporozyma servazzii]
MDTDKEMETKSVENQDTGIYDSTIISDIPNLMSEPNQNNSISSDKNDNAYLLESSSAFHSIPSIKSEQMLDQTRSNSNDNVKVPPKEEPPTEIEEEVNSDTNEEPIVQRMIHTKILEKDNPFLEDNGIQRRKELPNTISKSFTMASQKSHSIINPNGEYLKNEQNQSLFNGTDSLSNDSNPTKGDTNDYHIKGDFDITKDKNQLLSFQKGSSSVINKYNHNNSKNINFQTDLHEKLPKLENKIAISEATKVSEGQGRMFVAYTIINGTHSVRRRYSDFESLRNILMKLFPMILIPPIPEKQSLKNYSKAITNSGTNYLLSSDITGSLELSLSKLNTSTANSDEKFIRHRIKMLTKFLNQLINNDEIMNTSIISEFLNPNTPNWNDFVTNSPTFSNLPKNVLQCNPLDPTNTTRIHSSLPIPLATTQIQYPKTKTKKKKQNDKMKQSTNESVSNDITETMPNDSNVGVVQASNMVNSFNIIERDYKLYESLTDNEYKYNKRIMKNTTELKADYKEVSTELLQFSNKELQQLDLAEQFLYLSSAYDELSIISDSLVTNFNNNIVDQLSDMVHMAGSVRELIRFQKLKFLQKEMIRKSLKSKKNQLNKLQKEKSDLSPVDELIDQEMAKSHQISFQKPEPEQVEKQSYSGMFFKGFNKIATIVKDSVVAQDVDPDLLMESLKKEIKELEEILSVTENDLAVISKEIKENQLVRFAAIREEEMSSIMKNYAKLLKEFAEKNLKIWKDLKKNQESEAYAKKASN